MHIGSHRYSLQKPRNMLSYHASFSDPQLPPSPPSSLQSDRTLDELVAARRKTSHDFRVDPNYSSSSELSEGSFGEHAETKISYLDLRQVPEAIEHAWDTGRLPNWILNFPNLRILRASSMGITVVDDWVTHLKHLEVLILDQNQISTWPVHLVGLKTLKALFLDGNPCLENMFSKSASFRIAFFGSLAARPPNLASLPDSLNGPEWTPSTTVSRPSHSQRSNRTGYYCGGIYTLACPQNKGDDLLTPLSPCPLQQRIMSHISPLPPFRDTGSQVMLVYPPNLEVTFEAQRGSQLVIELLQDIAILLGKKDLNYVDCGLACLARTPCCDLSMKNMISRTKAFKLQEGLFIGQLSEVVYLFFRSRIKPFYAARIQKIFCGFNELYLFHRGTCLPLLKEILKNLESGGPVPESINEGVEAFCKEYAKCGLSFVASNTKLFSWSRDVAQGGSVEGGRFSEWIEAQEQKEMHTLPSCQNYLALPIIRLMEYNDYFTILARMCPAYGKLAAMIRQTREQVISQLQNTRRELQQAALAFIYGCDSSVFCDYHWDALVDLRSRTYLDRPKYEPVTADVLDGRPGKSMTRSVVKEIFNQGERQLRIIMCGRKLQLWDHKLKSHITTISIEDFEAGIQKDANGFQLIRAMFRNVDELWLFKLSEYHSVENFTGDNTTAFLTAVQLQSMPICCSHETEQPPSESAMDCSDLIVLGFKDADNLLGRLMNFSDNRTKLPTSKLSHQ